MYGSDLYTQSVTRTARFDIRLDPEDDFVIRRAAEVAGTSVSAFIVSSARDEAKHLLADRTVFVLDPEDWDRLQGRLAAPARVNRRLKRLFDEPDIFE